ncbi:MAG: hypothetical protein A2937_02970 [Candidatus Yonathbacteria bacterium RIFCSPLOWO2_01_FULL_47_33b]|uniref:CopG family transcriptional regulator n=1 Tax=Candidatus Yonathbacteria bacterium RIFCSPLOWO2_01_FULL_47_33b TaxID=1802727 RepID=A0A1G2SDN8_9BACT|nr:MAG: hypothetical protein A2937_02970 [Candidatus Yonathbacteria bacterium RIFCSPLOWO2_01_FULL_47_33b]
MATTKRRLNITLAPEVEKMITHIAKRDRVPEATKISELLKISLMMEEDKAFSLLADNRLKEKGKKLTHTEVWGK